MKRYHPDKHGMLQNAELREKINDICRITNLIYEKLVNY